MVLLAGVVVIAWTLPALGGAVSPSNERLAKRLDRVERRLGRVESTTRRLQRRFVLVRQVSVRMTLAAPGTPPIPGWLAGRADCPSGTYVSGGGARFGGVWGHQAVLEQSHPSGNGWYASLRYTVGGPIPTVEVYATCTDG